jgi:N-acetylmuramoyl-L-alanine amidase
MKRSFVCLCAAALLTGCSTPNAPTRTAPASVNLHQMLVPAGRVGRHVEFPLRPTYITIHSTDNRGGTALQHAIGMRRGAFRGRSQWNRTGYLTWHFTVDDRETIQHLPLNIQGEHADHDGPGNRTSIGIEICEFSDRRRQAAAIERAARLTAWLRREFRIPLDHVVPHYHWPQWHFHGYQKNCPRILLDHGRPGRKWQAFLDRVARS